MHTSHGLIAQTFYFNHKTWKWSNGPDLNKPRYLCAAGIVTDEITKEKNIVVSGGYNPSSTGFSTFIFLGALQREASPLAFTLFHKKKEGRSN